MLRTFYSLSLCLIISITVSIAGEAPTMTEDDVQSILNEDERVVDLLTDFPDLNLNTFFADEYGVWIVEIIHPEKGEIGVISVSPESKSILEYDVHIKRLTSEDDVESKETDAGASELWWRMLPHFEGTALVWFSLFVVFIFLFDFERVFSLRNFDLILLYALSPFLLFHWSDLQFCYTGLFIVTLLLLVRCFIALWLPTNRAIEFSFKTYRVVLFACLVGFLLHVQTVYQKGIGDVGIWSAIGTEYLKTSGNLPYGTEFGPNCVYGPLMYVTVLPASMIFPAQAEFGGEPVTLQMDTYERFEMRGVQSTVLLFDVITLLALYVLGRRLSGKRLVGGLIVLVYILSPYILGMVSEMGLERASHVLGTPFILLAMVWVSWPFVSGLLLGWATGMLFYPLFLAPLWFGYYLRIGGLKKALYFIAGYAVVGVGCLVLISLCGHGDSAIASINHFLDDTVMQQQFNEGYGTSELSFWGQYPALAEWGKPAVGVLYILFCLSLVAWPVTINPRTLIALTAAVLVGTQLVLAFGGGTYIGFYLAPLILTMFAVSHPEHHEDLTLDSTLD